jgi:hypothetical protein
MVALGGVLPKLLPPPVVAETEEEAGVGMWR